MMCPKGLFLKLIIDIIPHATKNNREKNYYVKFCAKKGTIKQHLM